MTLGIMQPYLFPYIGYFQLISMVDLFVIADDVQWINGGWINRNRILTHGREKLITLPMQRDSSRRSPINQRELGQDIEKQKVKLLRGIEGAYRHTPMFDSAYDLVKRCFEYKETNIAHFTTNALAECCQYLEIETPFIFSSKVNKQRELQAEEMVLEINTALSADHYVNPIGGTKLYNREHFNNRGLELSFLKSREIRYDQFNKTFTPSLSIIDVLMYNSKEQVAEMLPEFDLV